MCGICGFTGARDQKMRILQDMCTVMAHRGPDGEGLYSDDQIALGHRRLSLIDLEGGSQPMVRATGNHHARVTSPARRASGEYAQSHEDALAKGDWAIVFNGEIYNYQDLKAELEQEGWSFSTTSDTEVLLVAYIAWGEEALLRFRGMFAFAIWNRSTHELFCARDRFGIKPFYYTVQQDEFIFASEIKCILEHPAYTRALNTEALAQYLCFQFSALPETFFQGIFKLLQGHSLRVSADGNITLKRWWKPEFASGTPQAQSTTKTLQSAADDIDATMRESVHYHNVADVEVGSFLSSGIDSSYMAACLAQENPDIQTFTVGFAEYEGERDEISWAQELAGELGVKNTSKHITEEEYWDALPLVQWHMDEPSADPSAVALYFVDQLAAKHVKAVLSGEGADEFFGGYRVYQAPLATQKLQWVPRPLLRGAAHLLRALGMRGANYLMRASETVEDWYYTNANGVAFSPEERVRILKELPQNLPTPQQLAAPIYAEAARNDQVTRMEYVDMHFWLVGDILLKTDKMSMAHSLESRVPFLDNEVFATAAALPLELKVTDEQTKVALRRASERAIPQNWAQKQKLGFPVPVVGWLKQDAYYNKIRTWFTGPEATQFFNTDELVHLLDEHRSGTRDNTRRIWIIFMFLMWYRIYFVEGKKPA